MLEFHMHTILDKRSRVNRKHGWIMSALTINSRIRIPHQEFEFSFARSGGPGGQNVNKVNSKALLRWPVHNSPSLPADVRHRFLTRYRSRLTTEGEIILSSQRYRDQG